MRPGARGAALEPGAERRRDLGPRGRGPGKGRAAAGRRGGEGGGQDSGATVASFSLATAGGLLGGRGGAGSGSRGGVARVLDPSRDRSWGGVSGVRGRGPGSGQGPGGAGLEGARVLGSGEPSQGARWGRVMSGGAGRASKGSEAFVLHQTVPQRLPGGPKPAPVSLGPHAPTYSLTRLPCRPHSLSQPNS